MSDYRKDLKRLIRLAKRAGWEVLRSGGGHLKFISPTGAITFCSWSPRGHRAFADARANLRRAGLEV